MFRDGLFRRQKILVTGGGTGLGRAMAEKFLALGAEIAICGRRKAVCEATAAALTAAHGGVVKAYGVDIRDAAAVDAMVEDIFAAAPLTGLVNNAAGNFISRTEDLSPRGFRRHRQYRDARHVLRDPGGGKALDRRGPSRLGAVDHRHLDAQRRPVRRPLGNEQVGGAGDDDVARRRMGPLRHPPQCDRARRNPDRRHEQAPVARRRPRRRNARKKPARARRNRSKNCRISRRS